MSGVILASWFLAYLLISITRYYAYLNSGFREGSAKFSLSYYKEENGTIKVKAVTWLFKQFEALSLLFCDNETDLRLIRVTVSIDVLYIFGDASGSRFGGLLTEEDLVGFGFGVWNEEGGVNNSNYQDFRNLVESLEDIGRKKRLYGREVFLCTDNMVSDWIAVAGYSRAETLYDLVVGLHCLCMR